MAEKTPGLKTRRAPCRQVERRVPELIESARFQILDDRTVQQTFYPSRVLVARR